MGYRRSAARAALPNMEDPSGAIAEGTVAVTVPPAERWTRPAQAFNPNILPPGDTKIIRRRPSPVKGVLETVIRLPVHSALPTC